MAIGEAHGRYARRVNSRKKVRGYSFQGRFSSCPLDGEHCLAAVRYVELNPVRARKVRAACEYRWSNCRFHVGLRKRDVLVQDRDLPGLESKWRRYLRDDDELSKLVQDKTQTGRPCGSESFVRKIARRTGRALRPDKPGPKPNGQR